MQMWHADAYNNVLRRRRGAHITPKTPSHDVRALVLIPLPGAPATIKYLTPRHCVVHTYTHGLHTAHNVRACVLFLRVVAAAPTRAFNIVYFVDFILFASLCGPGAAVDTVARVRRLRWLCAEAGYYTH